jgi:hypothetical protein
MAVDANAVEISGPGIEPKKCRANVPQKFTVDAKKAGKAPLTVDVKSEKGITKYSRRLDSFYTLQLICRPYQN